MILGLTLAAAIVVAYLVLRRTSARSGAKPAFLGCEPVGASQRDAPTSARSYLTFTQPYIFPNTTCGVTLHRTR